MSKDSRREVRAGLDPCLARLWRYGLVLSGAGDVAEELVLATCKRAIERADQFVPGSRLDRWLFAILRSIWFSEIRPQSMGETDRDAAAWSAGIIDGVPKVNILNFEVLTALNRLTAEQREAAFLVYGAGYSYAEAARAVGSPVGLVLTRLTAARATLSKLKGETLFHPRR
jgi:RNA polymerase sigma-70 factor (ECF subfamily)